MTPALSFEQVSYRYPSGRELALRELNLQIEPGELCLLAGRSGQGKSSLMRAACGLVPHFYGGVFAGRVRLVGLDTREHPPAHLGAHVGVLQGDAETQLVMSTVRAELALPLECRGASAIAVARAVEEVALALGIDHLLERATHELSGGEKQRVALGAALVGRPSVVLLDEPTSQLDPVAGDELIGLLRRLNQEWDTTIVLSEHRLERCLSAADRVIAMEHGSIAHDGTPSSFLRWAASSSPSLQTPGAKLFALAGLADSPCGVKQARAILRGQGLLPEHAGEPFSAPGTQPEPRSPVRQPLPARLLTCAHHAPSEQPALSLRGVWFELDRGRSILSGVDLTIAPGELVALMGRNGAGKSTLLRLAAGLIDPTRGQLDARGRVALLLQNPNDYFLHERVGEELSGAALAGAGLESLAERNPRDLSGGERQRLALAIVSDSDAPAAVLALDEPTRGMDRDAKAELVQELRRRAREQGQAVIVATHDPEFAADCARRAILLAEGRVIADGPAPELLAGGWYFATETARILAGAGAAVRPCEGAALLHAARRAGGSDERDSASPVIGEEDVSLPLAGDSGGSRQSRGLR